MWHLTYRKHSLDKRELVVSKADRVAVVAFSASVSSIADRQHHTVCSLGSGHGFLDLGSIVHQGGRTTIEGGHAVVDGWDTLILSRRADGAKLYKSQTSRYNTIWHRKDAYVVAKQVFTAVGAHAKHSNLSSFGEGKNIVVVLEQRHGLYTYIHVKM